MLNFGPGTITYNGSALGDTFGGFSLKLNIAERQNVGSAHAERLVESGSGKINFYQWSSSILIGDSTSLLGYGEVILDGTPRYKVTLYSCRLLMDESFEGGKNEQKAFTCDLQFKKDNNGNIIKFE